MAVTAAVVGASGYAGGELLRLLAGHPALVPGPVLAGRQAGRPLAAVHPQLTALGDVVLGSTDPDTLASLADLGVGVVFLALPHGQSAAVVAALPPDVAVVDLGADYRLADPGAWQAFYGSEHAGTWTYGLPELPGARAAVAGATRVASPGCYPTSVALAVAPLVGPLGVRDVVVVAASGTSGAGRNPTPGLLGSEVMGSVSAYKAGGRHQHTPEMEQTLSSVAGHEVVVSFTPLLAPMPRGILATCSFPVTDDVTTSDVRTLLHETYADEPFVHVLAEEVWPRTADVAGSNAAHLQAAVDRHAARAVVVCAIDNLGKGAAGQALQNANLMLGLPETSGLSAVGVTP
jgi:N-acetyl-gamma-glutamyl-phosphate reductase